MTGAIFAAISMYQMTNVYGDLGFWFFARTRMVLGVGLPLIFIPIITASYDGIPANRVDMASALINAARNTGGSIGVSLASNVLTAPRAVPPEPADRERDSVEPAISETHCNRRRTIFLRRAICFPRRSSRPSAGSASRCRRNASYLAYMDVFWVLTLLSLAAVPLAMSLRKVRLGGQAPAAH